MQTSKPPPLNRPHIKTSYIDLAQQIKTWGQELGFQQVGIADTDLGQAEQHLNQWLDKGHHGNMEYMARHGSKRTRPAELVADTIRVISVRMDYRPPEDNPERVQADPAAAYISRYALGRDYHKTLRQRLKKLGTKIQSAIDETQFRVFVDSAPVMEKAIAEKAGLGWIGKHSNLINKDAGSWFFLGELYTNLPLPVDSPVNEHCGDCTACIDVCPTQAIIAPYQVDARRCISYLTIELKGSIPEEFRSLMGNHIYGCDDCQTVCPWNRFSTPTPETDFLPRHGLDTATLLELFAWDENTFLHKTEGSPIRRIGYESWQRNIAIAIGNGPATSQSINALKSRLENPSEIVREHSEWALTRLS